jgi:hypothetical protein
MSLARKMAEFPSVASNHTTIVSISCRTTDNTQPWQRKANTINDCYKSRTRTVVATGGPWSGLQANTSQNITLALFSPAPLLCRTIHARALYDMQLQSAKRMV